MQIRDVRLSPKSGHHLQLRGSPRTRTPQCCCGDFKRHELEIELRDLWAHRTDIFGTGPKLRSSAVA